MTRSSSSCCTQRATAVLLGLTSRCLWEWQAHRGLTRALQLFVMDKEAHDRLRFPAKEDVLRLFGEYKNTPIMVVLSFHVSPGIHSPYLINT